jgi:hypothetical protein
MYVSVWTEYVEETDTELLSLSTDCSMSRTLLLGLKSAGIGSFGLSELSNEVLVVEHPDITRARAKETKSTVFIRFSVSFYLFINPSIA